MSVDASPAVRATKTVARRIADAAGRSSVATRTTCSLLSARARRRGMPPEIVAAGRRWGETGPLRSVIGFFRLLDAVSRGDLSRLPSLLLYIPATGTNEAARWAVFRLAGLVVDDVTLSEDRVDVIRAAGPGIDREIDATGASSLFDWLVQEAVYRTDDVEFARVVELLIRRRVTNELRASTLTPPVEVREVRRSVTQLLTAAAETADTSVFIVGSTLRDEMTGRFESDPKSLEFGTFGAVTELARVAAGAGLAVVACTSTSLIVSSSDGRCRAYVGRYVRSGQGLTVHSNGLTIRWHSDFETVPGSLDGVRTGMPTEVDRHLAERFGPNWREPLLFFDDVFDAPNTEPHDTIPGLARLVRLTQASFATSDRFAADQASRQLKHRFGVDVTSFLPQAVHHKVLSIPLRHRPVAGSETVVVAGAFSRIDARSIESLTRLADPDRILVAAVRDTPDSDLGRQRTATLKTLCSVDHVMLYASVDDLLAQFAEIEPDAVYLEAGADVSEQAIRDAGVSVEPLDRTEPLR